MRGYFFIFAPGPATDPSPVPLRLVKAPAAGHPLPEGEGKIPISGGLLSRLPKGEGKIPISEALFSTLRACGSHFLCWRAPTFLAGTNSPLLTLPTQNLRTNRAS